MKAEYDFSKGRRGQAVPTEGSRYQFDWQRERHPIRELDPQAVPKVLQTPMGKASGRRHDEFLYGKNGRR